MGGFCCNSLLYYNKKNFANGSSFPIAIFLLTKVTISHNLEASIQTKTEAQ